MTAAAIDEGQVMAVLDTVLDPEVPVVSVVDLGIVRGLRTRSDGTPAVTITPTYTGCPATVAIERSIRDALDATGFRSVAIETVLSPAWTTDWITERGRQQLKDYGIAPPPRGSDSKSLRGVADIVECPRCGSTMTREVSRFGSTPCKALWQCRSCHEPFDRFKCH